MSETPQALLSQLAQNQALLADAIGAHVAGKADQQTTLSRLGDCQANAAALMRAIDEL